MACAANQPSILSQLLQAVQENKGGDEIRRILGHHNVSSSSLTEPLLLSSSKARLAMDELFAEATSPCTAVRPRDRILRSLLQSPSKYELPWEAACRAVQQLYSSADVTRADVHWTSSGIESFVQLAVSFWLEEERRLLFSGGTKASKPVVSQQETLSTRTPRNWLLRLMHAIVEPMRGAAQREPPDERGPTVVTPIEKETWRLPLGILSLLAMVSRDLDPSMLDTCLNLVCSRSVRLPFLASWLQVASDLAPHLRENDWANVHKLTLRSLSDGFDHDASVDGFQRALPDIFQSIMSLSSWVLKTRTTNRNNLMSWQVLILRLLALASQHDLDLYCRMEGGLQLQLGSLSSHSLQVWTSHAVRIPIDDNAIPSWMHCNVLLILRRVSRQTGAKMIARLVSKAFGGGADRSGDEDVDFLCRSRLLQCVCPAAISSSKPKGRPKSNGRSLSPSIDELLQGVSYAGSGCFHNHEGLAIEILCNAGRVVVRSLFPRRDTSLSQPVVHANDRGKEWVSIALEILEVDGTSDSQIGIILVVTILTTIFLEIPALRESIVRSLLECMFVDSEKIATDDEKLRAILTIIGIVSVSLDIVNDAPELNGFKSLFADHRLPLSLLLTTFESLQSLPSVKEASLHSALKVIESPSLHPFAWKCSQHSTKHLDEITFSLHALTSITAESRWGGVEYQAWRLLCDVIVGSKPIPVDSRSWLYERIQRQVEIGALHRNTKMHYLRALVTRLLGFFGWTDQNFDFFATTAIANREPICESFDGLLQTIFTLMRVAADDYRTACTISKWRSLMRELIQGESVCISDCTCPSNNNVDPSINAALYCVQFLLGQLRNKHPPTPETNGLSTLSFLEQIRIQEELALSGTSERPTCFVNQGMPATPFAESGACDNSRAESLRYIAYPLLVNFLIGPEWAGLFGATETLTLKEARRLAVGISDLFTLKSRTSGEASPSRLSTQCKALCAFCELGLPVIDSVLSNDEDFSFLDKILSFLLQICDSVYARSTSHSVRSLDNRLLVQASTTLWDIHMCISEEHSSIRLVKFLEKSSSNYDPVTHPARIGPIDTPADIDCTVREVRFRVLRALLCCLEGLIKTDHASLDQVITGFDNKRQLPHSLLDTKKAFTWIEVFSADLSQGIHGQSGGISYELFVVYLRCIEACAQHLKLHAHRESQLSCLRRVVIQTVRVSDALDLVLSCTGLKGSSAFKKALTLSAYTLPSLAAHAARSIAYTNQPINVDLTVLNCVSLMRYLFQCRKILDRSIEFTMTQCFAPWETVAGLSHVSESGGLLSEEFDSGEESSVAQDDTTVYRSHKYRHPYKPHEQVKSESRSIQLHSERAWDWALCTLLQSAEYHLHDSIGLLQDSKSTFQSKSNLTLLLQHRASHITEISAVIGTYFDLTEKERALAEDASQGHPPECRRMLSLSPAAKLRLLAFVDCYLAALQRSLTVIVSFLRRPYESNVVFNASTVEALAHLHCWLIRVEECSTCDLCVGVLGWFALERTKILKVPNKGTGPKTFCDGSMVQKIQKAVIRTEQLEVSLGRFHQELSAVDYVNEQPTARSLCKQRMLNILTKQLAACRRSGRESNLKLQVSKKLEELSSCRRLSLINETETNKRRWTDSDRANLGRQRNIRSRNRVIDEWLQLDCSIGQDEALEEDAYADLEDFLE